MNKVEKCTKSEMPPDIPAACFLAILSAGLIAAFLGIAVAVPGGEFGCGKGDSAEHFTGIFGAAGGFAAILGGDAVLQYRHHQLGIPLQTDDGELAQSHKQSAFVTGEYQLLVKHAADGPGDLGDHFSAGTVTDILDLGIENHGIQYLHHSGGEIGVKSGWSIHFSQTGIATVDMGPAVFTAEYGPFGEHSQTIEGGRPGGTYHRICQNPVIESDINAVVVSVKGDRLYINMGIQKLCAADPGIGCGVQKLLGTGGQVDPEIFNAIFIPAGIGDFSRVYGHGLTQVTGIAAQGVHSLL
jgi:hypothetical protein